MPTPDADKKSLSQAAGIPTHTEVLVQKACKTILGLADSVLIKRGCVPDDIKALAQQLSSAEVPQASAPMVPFDNKEVPDELMEPPTTLPDGEPETGSDSGEGEAEPESEDKNPGNLTYEDLDQMSKRELQGLAKDCGLSTSGNKSDVFNAVAAYLGLVD